MAKRPTKISAPALTDRQRRFLAAYPEAFTITAAAKAAQVDRREHYDWLKDEAYVAAWEQAQEAAADMLEELAVEHARAGAPGWQGMLTTLLKGTRPAKYRENVRHEHTGEVVHKVVVLGDDAPEDP